MKDRAHRLDTHAVELVLVEQIGDLEVAEPQAAQVPLVLRPELGHQAAKIFNRVVVVLGECADQSYSFNSSTTNTDC